MGYNVAFLLSLVYIAQVLLIGGDLVNVQVAYAELDALSLNVNQLVARQGGITSSIESFVNERNASIVCSGEICNPQFGEVYEYTLTRTFTPLIMSETEMNINITRAVVIGYYN